MCGYGHCCVLVRLLLLLLHLPVCLPPTLQYEIEHFVNYKVVQLDNDEIGIEITNNGAPTVFSPQAVVAMLLTKCTDIVADANSGQRAADVAISVPPYFTDRQRRAMLDAAAVAVSASHKTHLEPPLTLGIACDATLPSFHSLLLVHRTCNACVWSMSPPPLL